VRIVPDVLSDYLLEERCINEDGHSTRYADRVYEICGTHSLKNLMRNLAELDWRRGRQRDGGINLLNGIWDDIFIHFRTGDEFQRARVLGELSAAAIYQPDQILRLVRFAVDHPVVLLEGGDRSSFRPGQEYVLNAIPPLLEATAHHADKVAESVRLLWDFAKREGSRITSSVSAMNVLKRLSAWHRYGDAALNFAMLLQSIRLSTREDAFSSEFTPFTLIQQILEREGEFNEWQDEATISFGGFGLNYGVVGLIRENALDFLESTLSKSDKVAVHAIPLLETLLHNTLNRVGRQTTEDEQEWQERERERCVDILAGRIQQPASAVVKAKLYDALRSATAINCPKYVQAKVKTVLADIQIEDHVAVVDALCTADHDLPILSRDFSEARWEGAIGEVMARGRSALERLVQNPESQASFTINQTQACLELRIRTGGFHRFMLNFQDRPDFLSAMADHIVEHSELFDRTALLSSVFTAIHLSEPAAFRTRALAALASGATQLIHAAANNLRVFSGADEKDIMVVRAYASYPDPIAKRGASFAIAYMGKFVELRDELKQAALSIRTEGDEQTAAELADAFGPYGVPLTSLTREEAAAVACEFLLVHDWDVNQGAVPRFLSRLAELFPDEAFELLLRRCELNDQARVDGRGGFRTFHLVYQDVPFTHLSSEKRLVLGSQVLDRLSAVQYPEELAGLFWEVVGSDDAAFNLLLVFAPNADDQSLGKLCVLLDKAPARIVFTKGIFVKQLLSLFTGVQRDKLVTALAYQAYRWDRGVMVGQPVDYMADWENQFRERVASLPDDPGLADLHRSLRSFSS
jgi:hypothetical protein